MPRNDYSVLLGRRSDSSGSTASLYSQLQAPKQRQAIQESLEHSALESAPTVSRVRGPDVVVGERFVTDTAYTDSHGDYYYKDAFGITHPGRGFYEKTYAPSYTFVSSPAQNPVAYTDALSRATVAAYGQTINPADLVRMPGTMVESPHYIADAYLNPAAESAYDATPVFDWSGRQVAGVGATPVRDNKVSRVVDDVTRGPLSALHRYNQAISDSAANAAFAVAEAKAREAESRRALSSTLNFRASLQGQSKRMLQPPSSSVSVTNRRRSQTGVR